MLHWFRLCLLAVLHICILEKQPTDYFDVVEALSKAGFESIPIAPDSKR
jgi:predicted CoA-binding protein